MGLCGAMAGVVEAAAEPRGTPMVDAAAPMTGEAAPVAGAAARPGRPVTATARTNGTVEPLSMQELIARVRAHGPALSLLAAEVAAAEAEHAAAGLWQNPSLSFEREELLDGGRGHAEHSLRVEIPIELSGRRALEARAAASGVEAARALSKHAGNELLLEAQEAFLRAAAARLELAELEQEQARLAALVAVLGARRRGADASGHDHERLEIELEGCADLVAARRLSLQRHRRTLGWLVGTPARRYDAMDELALPAAARDAASGPAAGTGRVDAAARSVGDRPDVQAAAARARQAERALEAAGRGWVPELVLGGGLKTASAGGDTLWGYGAGASLTLPFVDHGQGEAARARAQLARARAEQRWLEGRAAASLATTREALASALGQAERFERAQTPRAERLLRRATLSYEEGEQPIYALLDAYRTARAVRIRSIELRLEARLLELELWRALGRTPERAP